MGGPSPSDVVHLRRGGTSVVVDLGEGRLPRILHWGDDLGDLEADDLEAIRTASQPTIGDSVVTYPQPVPVLPLLAEGWLGRPGVAGSRAGRAFAPLFTAAAPTPVEGGVRSTARDAVSELDVEITLALTPEGVLTVDAAITNSGVDPYSVHALEPALPVPDRADEILDLTGRWARERSPQRHAFPVGAWVRESRGGKPGLEHSTLFAAGESGFGFERGAVWAIHLGWSGNQVLAAERMPAGTRLLRAGELLHPDEIVLAEGETYRAPTVYGMRGDGLNELSDRTHRMMRARPSHPSGPRPVLVNTWEAVYFDHDVDKLRAFARRAADLGAERFVVDDGWFEGRRDDRTSLGDWDVDRARWPEGLAPFAAYVRDLGMQFGLWFEPEMVNLDSDLARAHPEWVFDAGHGPGLPSRHQHVLDLGHPEAYAHVLTAVSRLVDEVGIDFIKWDHNRYLLDAAHSTTGRAGVHAQTLAVYRLMDELRRRHRGLEIESCASGGGRIDLGILARTDRVWPSDDNDPHERGPIQRWTSMLVPLEMQGTHIGAEVAHVTHRTASFDHRAATAFWGNLGVELDLADLDDETFARTARWVSAHKRFRALLHAGRLVRADTPSPVRVEGVVARDGSEAVFAYILDDLPATWPPTRMRLPGLNPDAVYEVTELAPGDPVPDGQRPPWMAAPLHMTGRVLHRVGLEPPLLDPDRTALFHVVLR